MTKKSVSAIFSSIRSFDPTGEPGGDTIKILRYFRRPLVAVLVAVLFPIWLLAQHHIDVLYQRIDGHYDGELLKGVQAQILKKDIKKGRFRYTIKIPGEDGGSFWPGCGCAERGIVTSEEYDIPVGSWIDFDARLMEMPAAQNEGGFDMKRYYAVQKVTFYGELTCLHRAEGGSFLYEALWGLRRSAADFYDASLPGEESGLMAAMALGDRGELSDEVRELFSEAGIAHLLAVSGLHISIVGMGLYRLLRRKKLSYLASGVVSLFLVGCYGMMTGLGTSTLRAVIMFCVMIGGEILGEAYDVGSGAALSAMIILAGSPTALFDTGFLFSFGAVFGIVYVAGPMQKIYEKRRRLRFGDMAAPQELSTVERFVSALIFGVGLQLATLPVIALSYHRISPYVIILNILLLPFMGLLIGWGLTAGIICGLAGSVPAGAAFTGAAGSFIMLPCHCILYIYEMVSELMLRLPLSTVTIGHPHVHQLVLYYALLMLGLLLILRSDGERAWMGAAVIFLAAFISLCHGPSRQTEIDMLSVGQGDGLCMISREGEVFMVDGGSTSEDELARYTLAPYFRYKGISRVSYWFVTHMDEDHYSGLFELLRDDLRIENVVLAQAVEKNDAYYELLELCRETGTGLVYMRPGDRCGTESMGFTCLFPDCPSGYSGTNENSLCLMLSYGDFDMVLTGDMGEEQERDLLAVGMPGRDIEVLKSAHHGSKNSNCREWLSAVSPELCIISAGRHNRYHHPSPDTISRMDELSIPHICTIDTGEIMIFPEEDGRFCVRTCLENFNRQMSDYSL